MAAATFVASCGFSPAYAPVRWHGAVAIDTPKTVLGFRMGERLTQGLGDARQPHYRLTAVPQSEPEPATITEDGDSTRFNLTGNVSWSLRNAAGEEIGAGLEQTFTAYSATGSTVATQAAQSDAEARLAVALADLILQRLSGIEVAP